MKATEIGLFYGILISEIMVSGWDTTESYSGTSLMTKYYTSKCNLFELVPLFLFWQQCYMALYQWYQRTLHICDIWLKKNKLVLLN